jgi:hypothetical protein
MQRLAHILKRHVHALVGRFVERLLVHRVVARDALCKEILDVRERGEGWCEDGEGGIAVQGQVRERDEREFGEQDGLDAEGEHVGEGGVEELGFAGEGAGAGGGEFGLRGGDGVDCALGDLAEGGDGGAVEAVGHWVRHVCVFLGRFSCDVQLLGEVRLAENSVRRPEGFLRGYTVRYIFEPRPNTLVYIGATRYEAPCFCFDAILWRS